MSELLFDIQYAFFSCCVIFNSHRHHSKYIFNNDTESNDRNDCDLRAYNDLRIKEIPWTLQISIRLIYPWEDKVSWRSAVRLRYTQKRLPARHWKCDRHLIGTRYPVTRVTNFSVFYLPQPSCLWHPRSRPLSSFLMGATPRVETP